MISIKVLKFLVDPHLAILRGSLLLRHPILFHVQDWQVLR